MTADLILAGLALLALGWVLGFKFGLKWAASEQKFQRILAAEDMAHDINDEADDYRDDVPPYMRRVS